MDSASLKVNLTDLSSAVQTDPPSTARWSLISEFHAHGSSIYSITSEDGIISRSLFPRLLDLPVTSGAARPGITLIALNGPMLEGLLRCINLFYQHFVMQVSHAIQFLSWSLALTECLQDGRLDKNQKEQSGIVQDSLGTVTIDRQLFPKAFNTRDLDRAALGLPLDSNFGNFQGQGGIAPHRRSYFQVYIPLVRSSSSSPTGHC